MPSLDDLTPDRFQQVIMNLSLERNCVVTGVAGSGKSMILLKKAKQASTKTKSYAIIVYTKSLKQFFVDELKEINQNLNNVFYYAEWKRKTRKNVLPHYNYLFVDECQDFNADDIENFRSYGTYCWFFGDTDQSIMNFDDHSVQNVRQTADQIGVHTQDLTLNHRLTVENAKVGEYIKQNRLSNACFRHGDKPKNVSCSNQLDKIIEYKNAGSSDIGILVYHNRSVELIRDYFHSKGIPVQWKTRDDMEIDFKSTAPKVITWHCAKGLQFSNVFIPFCGMEDARNFCGQGFEPTNQINALYVATTRAIENLYLLNTNDLSHNLPPQGSDIYSQSLFNNVATDYNLPF